MISYGGENGNPFLQSAMLDVLVRRVLYCPHQMKEVSGMFVIQTRWEAICRSQDAA